MESKRIWTVCLKAEIQNSNIGRSSRTINVSFGRIRPPNCDCTYIEHTVLQIRYRLSRETGKNTIFNDRRCQTFHVNRIKWRVVACIKLLFLNVSRETIILDILQ